jgi:hypothetical protein
MQWAANGHIAVIGHGGQEGALCADEGDKEEKLGHTGHKGNMVGPSPQPHKQGGHGHRHIGHLQAAEVAQEEVHGLVELTVSADEVDDERVLQEDQQVQHEEDGEQCIPYAQPSGKPSKTNCWTLVMLATSRDVSICGETRKIELLLSEQAQYHKTGRMLMLLG